MLRPLALILLLASQLGAQELLTDSWKKLRDKDPLHASPYWDWISDGGAAEWAPDARGQTLRLSQGLRLRSRAVSPFAPTNTISGRWSFAEPAGSAGIGIIDFASNIFFYLYASPAENALVLVRGNGAETTELHRSPFTPGATPHIYTLTIQYQEKSPPKFTLLVDGSPIATEIPDPSASPLSSNFYVYYGISADAVIDCNELTAVNSPATSSKSWFW